MIKPECHLGYTSAQVERIMGERLGEFLRWNRGSTHALCDGRRYNHDTGEYEASGCGPHGGITYVYDVQRFLRGLPNDD